MVCPPCKRNRHGECLGGNHCDCQHHPRPSANAAEWPINQPQPIACEPQELGITKAS